MILVANQRVLSVDEGAFREILTRALHYGSYDEPDGIDSLIHTLLHVLDKDSGDLTVAATDGVDWVEAFRLVSIPRGELERLAETEENDTVAAKLWDMGLEVE